MKYTTVKNLLRAGLLAATALSAAACVVEPAYGPAYQGYYYTPAPVYVAPGFEYHEHGHWHRDHDGDRHDWH
ncbi:MAG: hypothetical protein ISP90_14220 [Nevskia sp.]|nr:hypothetical protein [Nevskia sp.]